MFSSNYHEVFVPGVDVCVLGGEDVFTKLHPKVEGQKNLVLVPTQLIDDLNYVQEGNIGADQSLLWLDEIRRKNGVTYGEEGIGITPVSSDIHIGFINSEMMGDNPLKYLIEIQEKVAKSVTSDVKGITYLTSKEAGRLHLGLRGIRAEEPEFLQVDVDIVNRGLVEGNGELYTKLQQDGGSIPLEEALSLFDPKGGLNPNQFISFSYGDKIQYARITGDAMHDSNGSGVLRMDNQRVVLLDPKEYSKTPDLHVRNHRMDSVLGISPRDLEQYLAMEYLLLNPDVEMVFICGGHGSGKTFLSYLSAVEQILHYDDQTHALRKAPGSNRKGGLFDQMVLFKADNKLGGRDAGTLPGGLWEKIKGTLLPFEKSHKGSDLRHIPFVDMFCHPNYKNDLGVTRRKDIKKINGASLPPRHEAIELMYSGDIRGVSFTKCLMEISEAQNFTPYEMKTIIGRAGNGCKIIIDGDPDQFDNPDCSRDRNGLTSSIDHFLGRPNVGLIKLTGNRRHVLAGHARSMRAFSSDNRRRR